MNIEDFISFYPESNNKEYQKKLFQMKEFHDLKLSSGQIEKLDNNFKHQIIIERFLSPYTDNNVLLLVHGLGNGKTRSSILVENINRGYKDKALVITKNKLLIENYKNELVIYDKKYLPIDENNFPIDPIKDNQAYHNQLTRKTNVDYDFFTYEELFNKYNSVSDIILINTFSNRIIIIDEAHNLRIQQHRKKETLSIYNFYHKLLHIVTNSKIMLMTGTPIIDNSNEIGTMMNLILPLSTQIDITNFDKDYFIDGKFVPDRLTNLFSGKISFLRELQESSKKYYKGEIREPLKYTKLVYDEMSKEQYKVVSDVKKIDKAFRLQELEASNFVYTDEGIFGKQFYNKYFSGAVDKKILNNVIDNIKKNLKTYSSKYYSIIQTILSFQESVFVYHYMVHNSGAILLGKILEIFGLEKANTNRNVFSSKKNRYAIITEETTNKSQALSIIKQFNDPRNKDGEYIRVLIGSSKISTGITLKNVKKVHIVTPFWNFATIDQAIGRTVRIGSHIDKGVTVDIYLHASSYKNRKTVDIEAYKISEEKDYKTRFIYRFLKEISFDCPETYDKNIIIEKSKNYTRECDYQKCYYQCLQYNNEVGKLKIKDVNYNLFFSEKDLLIIKNIIENLFKVYNVIDFPLIRMEVNEVEQYSDFLILKVLEHIVLNRITLYNRYGLITYLNEKDNVYYLNYNLYQKLFSLPNTIIYKHTPLSSIKYKGICKNDKKYIDQIKDGKNVSHNFKQLNNISKIIVIELAFVHQPKFKPIYDEYKNMFYTINLLDILKNIGKKQQLEILSILTGKKVTESDLPNIISDEKIIDKIKQIHIHKLFFDFFQTTKFKKIPKATGNIIRIKINDDWKFMPINIEEIFIREINNIDKLSEKLIKKEDLQGEIDRDNNFRFSDSKSKGNKIVCITALKPRIISNILSIVQDADIMKILKDMKIDHENIDINVAEDEYLEKYKGNDLMLKFITVLSASNKKDLCDILKKVLTYHRLLLTEN